MFPFGLKGYFENFPGIAWESTLLLSSHCADFTIKYFPFDHQNCEIIFDSGSPIVNIEIDMAQVIEPENFIGNTEVWQITGLVNGSHLKITWEIFDKAYERVKRFHIHLSFRRKYEYYITTIYLPITVLILLQISSLLMAPDDSNRATFCITVQLAYAVVLNEISSLLPVTSEICYTNVLVAVNFCICSFLTFYTLLSLILSTNLKFKKITYFSLTRLRFCDFLVASFAFAITILMYITYISIVLDQY